MSYAVHLQHNLRDCDTGHNSNMFEMSLRKERIYLMYVQVDEIIGDDKL